MQHRAGSPDGRVLADGGGGYGESATAEVVGELAEGLEFGDGHRWEEY